VPASRRKDEPGQWQRRTGFPADKRLVSGAIGSSLIRVTLDPRAVRWSGLPMPHRRTFADAIVASAHSDWPALRHPAFADRSACGGSVPALKPAPGPWATPPDPMVQQDRLGCEDQVGAVSEAVDVDHGQLVYPPQPGHSGGNSSPARHRAGRSKSPVRSRHTQWMWLAGFPSASGWTLQNSIAKVGPSIR